MSSVRRFLVYLCLALTVSASIPCRAESGNASRGSEGGGAAMAQRVFTPTTLGTSFPLKTQMQATETTSSGHMSGKKKAWIIVGCVLGAIAIGAAISNHGGGDSGGGY